MSFLVFVFSFLDESYHCIKIDFVFRIRLLLSSSSDCLVLHSLTFRQTTRGWSHAVGQQHPTIFDSASSGGVAASARWHADFRQDPHRQDDHPRSRAVRHNRECQGEDPGQGGHPAGPAASELRWFVLY